MHFRLILTVLLFLAPTAAWATPQPLGTLWRHAGNAVLVTPCPPGGDSDESCRALAVRRAGVTTYLGGGYIVTRLLWTRPPHGRGPDVLLRGDSGGSGGNADLFAVTFAPQLVVRKWSGERYNGVTGRAVRGTLHVDLPFDIEFFNGASHADVTIVPVPVLWRGGDFTVNFPALMRPPLSPDERAFRELALGRELARWSWDAFPAKRLYPPEVPIAHATTPVTVQALTELMLSGRADEARALLHHAWPGSRGDIAMGGEDALWDALCSTLVSHPLWRRLRLDRLPHADTVVAGAGRATGLPRLAARPISGR